jgi:hypothetical protein
MCRSALLDYAPAREPDRCLGPVSGSHGCRGIERRLEIFPDKPEWDRYGDWPRLPGRHHTRQHFTRIWNDEPFAEVPWLEGHDAIDRIVARRPADVDALARVGVTRLRRTVCLDFDGVVHSYRSGWRGATVIPDPPIHGTAEARFCGAGPRARKRGKAGMRALSIVWAYHRGAG